MINTALRRRFSETKCIVGTFEVNNSKSTYNLNSLAGYTSTRYGSTECAQCLAFTLIRRKCAIALDRSRSRGTESRARANYTQLPATDV